MSRIATELHDGVKMQSLSRGIFGSWKSCDAIDTDRNETNFFETVKILSWINYPQ